MDTAWTVLGQVLGQRLGRVLSDLEGACALLGVPERARMRRERAPNVTSEGTAM